jgi:hypothetical protein
MGRVRWSRGSAASPRFPRVFFTLCWPECWTEFRWSLTAACSSGAALSLCGQAGAALISGARARTSRTPVVPALNFCEPK